MFKKVFLAFSLVCLLSFSGCAENGALVRIGPTTQTNFIPVQPGNPATVVDKSNVSTIKTDDGKVQVIDDSTKKVIIQGTVGDMNLQGFDVIDDPTLQYYQMLHKMYGADYQKKLANGEVK